MLDGGRNSVLKTAEDLPVGTNKAILLSSVDHSVPHDLINIDSGQLTQRKAAG